MQIKFDANKKRLDTTPAFGLLVQGENLAESIQITGPKMVGALDLSQLRVAVRMTSPQYETTVEKTLEQTTDGDTITFTWQVDKQFTGSPGKVDVMLVGYGGNDEVIKITSSGMVVQEDRTFDTAPPESTWEQILQQMQDFATQAYESKTAAANSAAAAAASQKVAEEKAAQATNAANEAVKAAETAAADAAAQAAAKTEQQIRQYADDRYARPLVTKTGPAARLEVYPDKLSNLKVYANGFTQQEGSGDASPVNVRPIVNGGLKLVEVILNAGTRIEWSSQGSKGGRYFITVPVEPKVESSISAVPSGIFCNAYKTVSKESTYIGVNGISDYAKGRNMLCLYDEEFLNPKDVSGLRKKITDRYNAGDPIKIWYQPADESDATGLYAPIILTSGEYRATCLPLTAPLCDGDSVVSWVKSGCDKVVTFDGSENWVKSAIGFYIAGPLSDFSGNSNGYCDQYPVSTVKSVSGSVYWDSAAFSVYDASYDSLESFKAALAAHPLTIWYRSANYTESADKPVSLETHVQTVLVLDGTEGTGSAGIVDETGFYCFFENLANNATSSYVNNAVCDHFKNANYQLGTGFTADKLNSFCINNTQYGVRLVVYHEALGTTPQSSALDCVNAVKAYLAAQYAAGTPVTIVYQLATPITYAHEAVVLPALPDDTGKVTITGQSGGTVTVVFNKSIIKEIAEIKAAMLAMGANLSM